jgi:hypothetical protein
MWTSKWFFIRIYGQNRHGLVLRLRLWRDKCPDLRNLDGVSYPLPRMESYEALQLGQMYFLADLSELVSATIVCLSLPSFLSPLTCCFFSILLFLFDSALSFPA